LERRFPGIDAILGNSYLTLSDKNKLPLASLKAPLDLTQVYAQDEGNSANPESKPFLFVVDKVPLGSDSEDIQ